jgi:membrane protein
MIDRLKRLMHDADAWLLRHRWTRIGRRAVAGFLEHESLQNAGSMAYFSILSVFQLLVLGVVVMSFFLGEGGARDFVIEQVEAGTPMDPGTIAAIIDGVIESRGGIGLVSAAFLLWGALGVFSALNRGIASAFVAAKPRGFVQDKLVGLALMAVTGLLGVASIGIGIVTGIVQQAAADRLAQVPGAGLAVGAIGFLTPIVLIFLAFLAIYRIVPNRPVSIREVWPGAVVATLLWTALRIGFTWYATSIANYDSAFGPISAAISLLVFLYFASVIVLLGAEVARARVLDTTPEVTATAAPPAEAARPPSKPSRLTPPAAADDVAGRLPGWAVALGGALAAAAVRWLSSRRRG